MLLAIDAGNTNIVFAVYNGEEKLNQWRVETHKLSSDIFSEIQSDFSDIDDVIICSVVPKINDALVENCQEFFNVQADFVTHENIDIEIKIDKPQQLGTDRMVGASAAVQLCKTPIIVVDFGTSTNFDVIDAKGAHCGGVLATGAKLSLSALEQAAAQLPNIEIAKPQNIIGTNTLDAMQSGIYWGYIAMVEGLIVKIKTEMNEENISVVATGGLAPLFEQGTDMFDIMDQDLIMKGLLHMHKVIKGLKG